MTQKLATVTEIDYACTLEECAAALGCSKQRVWYLQQTALQKLRRHPLVVHHLRLMAADLVRRRASSSDEFSHWLS